MEEHYIWDVHKIWAGQIPFLLQNFRYSNRIQESPPLDHIFRPYPSNPHSLYFLRYAFNFFRVYDYQVGCSL
jgi:hypothetical protein